MPGKRATAVGLTRPAGLSPGAAALIATWVAMVAIGRLTGAAAVVILLGASVVGAVWAAIAGWIRLRSFELRELTTVASATVGDSVSVAGRGRDERGGSADVLVRVIDRGSVLASGRMRGGRFDERGQFSRRGLVDSVHVRARSAGRPGLVWWERCSVVDIDPVVVAPPPAGPGARVEAVTEPHGGGFTGSSGSHDGDIDGIRPWRDGDSERSVHWATSLRTGDLVVLDHHRSADTRWIVRVDEGAGDAETKAGRVRWALDEGRRRGVRTAAAVGDEEPVEIPDADAAARWSATCVPGEAAPRSSREPGAPAEDGLLLTTVARWATAAATFASLALLVGGLGSSLFTMALLAAGTAAGAALTTRYSGAGRELPSFVRVVVAVGALGGLAVIASGAGTVSGLLAVLRGPLPQFLMLLVVLHGFECNDRRTARVELAISAVVAGYAAGLRVDGHLGWWLAAWGACFLSAIVLIARDDRAVTMSPANAEPARASRPRVGRIVRPAAGLVAGGLATVLLLSLIPVPSAVIRVAISANEISLSKRARSTFRILPLSGRIAWFLRSRPCLAEPPAESPSTR